MQKYLIYRISVAVGKGEVFFVDAVFLVAVNELLEVAFLDQISVGVLVVFI